MAISKNPPTFRKPANHSLEHLLLQNHESPVSKRFLLQNVKQGSASLSGQYIQQRNVHFSIFQSLKTRTTTTFLIHVLEHNLLTRKKH